jgi:hypothetical protein
MRVNAAFVRVLGSSPQFGFSLEQAVPCPSRAQIGAAERLRLSPAPVPAAKGCPGQMRAGKSAASLASASIRFAIVAVKLSRY